MLIATFWLALVVSMPGIWAWSITAVTVALMAGAYLSYGSATIEVADGELRAGAAHIPVALLSEATPLDAEESRLLAGRNADPRAFLLLRPYLKRSIRVTVDDPSDPTPYWQVGTRHPRALAAAIEAARTSAERPGSSVG